MKLSELYLQNFRNIEDLTLNFSEGITLFVGRNGQGKTNLIEAIFSLSLSRPFRSRKKEVFLQHGAEYGRVKGMVSLGNEEEETLEIFWQQNGNRSNGTVFQRNGVKKSSPEFLGHKHFFAVLFAPEDMDIPVTTPKNRRQFLSRVLSPLFPEYLTSALKYDKVLRHRNKLLSEFPHGNVQRMEFHFWDSELEKWSEVISDYRRKFCAFISERIAQKYRAISHTDDVLKMCFMPSVGEEKSLFGVLEQNFSQDVRFGSTQKGPHRDDFSLLLRGRPLSETASRGEMRSAMIALKVCERDFVAEHTSLTPVLLLDDVFSELDSVRRSALLTFFQSEQVFISTTDVPEFSEDMSVQVFTVENGTVLGKSGNI